MALGLKSTFFTLPYALFLGQYTQFFWFLPTLFVQVYFWKLAHDNTT